MSMKNRTLNSIPTFFSLGSLFCGFAAIAQAAQEHFITASWLIFLAAVFDAVDGRIARMAGRSSDFGIQMDSLCDVVSFGLAPSFLIYMVYFRMFGTTGLMFSFSPLLFAAIRLARFNLLTMEWGKKSDFWGMPSPMAALTMVSIVLLYFRLAFDHLLASLFLIVPIVSLLMVSPIRYNGFPRFRWNEGGANRIKLVIFMLSLVLLPIFKDYFLFVFMMIYMLSGPFFHVLSLFTSEDEEMAILAENQEDILPGR